MLYRLCCVFLCRGRRKSELLLLRNRFHSELKEKMIVSRAPRTSIYTKIRRNRNLRALPLERVAQQDTAVAAILHCPIWDEELHGASTTTSRTARCPFPYHIQGPKCSAALVSISNDWQHCATQTPVRSAPVRPYSAALVSRKNNDLRHCATQTPVRSAPFRPYSAALVAEERPTTCDTVQHDPNTLCTNTSILSRPCGRRKTNDLRHCAARPQYALHQYVETQPPLSTPATTGNTVQHSPGVRSAPIPRDWTAPCHRHNRRGVPLREGTAGVLPSNNISIDGSACCGRVCAT